MLQNKGNVYYINKTTESEVGTNEQKRNNDFINFNLFDSAWRNIDKWLRRDSNNEREKSKELHQSGGIKMDGVVQELVTAITSAIAGVYCLVKVIINLINKIKK